VFERTIVADGSVDGTAPLSNFLDAKGLKCPLPVLRAKRAMRALAPGEILVIEATDSAAPDDFRAFCDTTGHELLATEEADGIFVFRIRRAG
jgi:tRNA 2-thiouridine synthesizing protein A